MDRNQKEYMDIIDAMKRDAAPYIRILSHILSLKPIKQITMLQDGKCYIDYGGKSQVEIEIEKTIQDIELYYKQKLLNVQFKGIGE